VFDKTNLVNCVNHKRHFDSAHGARISHRHKSDAFAAHDHMHRATVHKTSLAWPIHADDAFLTRVRNRTRILICNVDNGRRCSRIRRVSDRNRRRCSRSRRVSDRNRSRRVSDRSRSRRVSDRNRRRCSRIRRVSDRNRSRSVRRCN
jgi:hypothetical protein